MKPDRLPRFSSPSNCLVQTLEQPMLEVDWQAAEELLVRESVARFPEIAAKYAEEEFYGVFFDCDIVHTCAQAHMNTNVKLREYAQRCKDDDLTREQPLYLGLSVDELMEQMRWDAGGWGYFSIFAGPDFDEVAAAYKQMRETVGGSEGNLRPLREAFMLMACKAVIRIERAGAFEPFRQTPDFRVLCVYIQESVEEGEERLHRVRESFNRT
jgi:hypothetical protein